MLAGTQRAAVCAANAGEPFAHPSVAAERGYVDALIQPGDTRRRMIAALVMLHGKRNKNSPQKARKNPLESGWMSNKICWLAWQCRRV